MDSNLDNLPDAPDGPHKAATNIPYEALIAEAMAIPDFFGSTIEQFRFIQSLGVGCGKTHLAKKHYFALIEMHRTELTRRYLCRVNDPTYGSIRTPLEAADGKERTMPTSCFIYLATDHVAVSVETHLPTLATEDPET